MHDKVVRRRRAVLALLVGLSLFLLTAYFGESANGGLHAVQRGALLQGLDERLRDETQMPAHLAESPLTCVAVGSGRSLEEFEAIHRANKNSRTSRRR